MLKAGYFSLGRLEESTAVIRRGKPQVLSSPPYM